MGVITTNTNKKSLFVTSEGQNVLFTFILVSSLFLLWGVCNGMIDVMDKHFQDGVEPEQVAVRLGAVRALPGLLPDVGSGRLAGHANWGTRAASSRAC